MAIIKPNNNTLSSITALPTGLGGKVLQVQETTKLDISSVSVTAGTFTDVSGLAVNITPSSSSNKILCMAFVNGSQHVGVCGGMFTLFRDSTEIFRGDTAGSRQRATGSMMAYQQGYINGNTPVILDEPNSTSQLAYKVGVTSDANNTVFINATSNDSNNQSYVRGASSIVVMEIAG